MPAKGTTKGLQKSKSMATLRLMSVRLFPPVVELGRCLVQDRPTHRLVNRRARDAKDLDQTAVNIEEFGDLCDEVHQLKAKMQELELQFEKTKQRGTSSFDQPLSPLSYSTSTSSHQGRDGKDEVALNSYGPGRVSNFEETGIAINNQSCWLYAFANPVTAGMLELLTETRNDCFRAEMAISTRNLADRFFHPENPAESIASLLLLGISAHHLYLHHIITLGHAQQLRISFYTQARDLMSSYEESTTSDSTMIEVFLLCGTHFMLDNRVSQATIHTGFAVRLAQQHGYHRRSSMTKVDAAEAEMRKRLFYTCYINDFMMSFQTGISSIIEDTEIDQDLPNSMINEGEAQRIVVLCLNHLIPLISIWRKMSGMSGELCSVLQDLVRWHRDLPDYFRPFLHQSNNPGSNNCSISKQAGIMLNVLYHALSIKARQKQVNTTVDDQSIAADGIVDLMCAAAPEYGWCSQASLMFDCLQIACAVRGKDIDSTNPAVREAAKVSLMKASFIVPKAPPSIMSTKQLEQTIMKYLRSAMELPQFWADAIQGIRMQKVANTAHIMCKKYHIGMARLYDI
ncbi:fungal-specific transcription factor domain-containing protein [Jimgerdemannia flammicorona]|uniref:Fungal-specific transcription factor domain-containing protein n=1 Tax=Jimgerdemannia flammicorona TaxID=994334 RepID=A0A433Q525_9FUNG|nr:fungal-specific transcription factor domain-containing protein [Jimgerdemannia flammicorona]